MSALPGRPDLDQRRRQARELLRAAAANEEQVLRRIRAVSKKQTLSAAHFAIAREHGFSSWPRLRRSPPPPRRRAGRRHRGARRHRDRSRDRGQCRGRAARRNRREVLAGDARVVRPPAGVAHQPGRSRLERANRRRYPSEPSRRASPAQVAVRRGCHGYAQALLVWETFGYTEFLVADAEELTTQIGAIAAPRRQG
jgi:hypothetical protein